MSAHLDAPALHAQALFRAPNAVRVARWAAGLLRANGANAALAAVQHDVEEARLFGRPAADFSPQDREILAAAAAFILAVEGRPPAQAEQPAGQAPQGCLCPAGAHRDCQGPLCPRRPVDLKAVGVAA